MISVAIVEDNAPLRAQYADILERAPGFRCAGACPDAESALAELPAASPAPDVILMDIGLPGMSGVDCAARLKRVLPDTDILMLTVYDDSNLIFRALENGASGFLLKRTGPAELLRAIEDVRRGGAPMSPHVARLVVRSFRREPASSNPAASALTPREEEVLRLVSRGLINKEVADELGITVETVRQHLKKYLHQTPRPHPHRSRHEIPRTWMIPCRDAAIQACRQRTHGLKAFTWRARASDRASCVPRQGKGARASRPRQR